MIELNSDSCFSITWSFPKCRIEKTFIGVAVSLLSRTFSHTTRAKIHTDTAASNTGTAIVNICSSVVIGLCYMVTITPTV